ncbi:hypothetical protein BFP97_06065 [Roseivirga sp. 4D4]|uniref:GNAT family N-acetyltransferase n=1 Tax=Roseivirga sp. 4D4 TaxID=1889784 RepID=UPI000852E4B9|nr:GNAT family N-acetyltransferase [Roseivirga sp. 4D4]OEK01098.1 hypothetical protein BFP97_06065 [Roseivirga sp. 4D4]
MSTILHANRIILRPQRLTDLDSLHKILSNQRVMKYYPKTYTREDSENWILRNIESYEKHCYGLWAVEKDGAFIGQCGISNQKINDRTVQELGFHIDELYWRKGFAFEASQSCIKYGFNTLELQNIYIITSIDNVPAQQLARKLGMISDGKLIKSFCNNLKVEHLIFKLSKEMFKESSSPAKP